jgi:1-phosphofructokinase
MIVTLTLNPSVDRTVEVETLARGEVMRALRVRVDPGGKGINVSRALAAHDLPTRAVVTVGGAEGEHLVTLLRETGIEIVPVPVQGAIRSNITVVEPDGTTTKFYEPGAQLSNDELGAVFDAV